jgi:CheY-like chemotaxis protein
VKYVPSNSWTLSPQSPPSPSELPKDHGSQLSLEQLEAAERRQQELAEQSSELNTPAVRIRAWERLHRLTLPYKSEHPVLRVIASATHLTLAQVREEQRRRSAPADRSRRVDSEASAAAPQAHADSDSTSSAQTLNANVTATQQLEPAEDDSRVAESARILIVENDIDFADSLERMLQALGYSQTRIAYYGHTALPIAAEFRPNVVLLEINLLDMNGYELAKLLRDHAQGADLRLIALTSSSDHEDRERARIAGFERYLLKPVAPTDLSELLQAPAL